MIRVGIGYDIHRMEPGRVLVLGGVTIPFEKGFLAHSDGDVLCHAIADALLGAAGLPDIGVLFPDTDVRYQGADSMGLLSETLAKIREKGYVPAQLDANIIAQRPKLQPYVTAMRENLAACLHLDLDCISVKPRTNEGCGPEGREEAISAHAVVVLTLPPV